MHLTPIVSQCSSNFPCGRGFSHRVCYVQIHMHLVNPSVSVPDVVSCHMELSENVLGCRVSSWLLRVSNGTCVVVEDSHGVSAAGKDAKLDHELLQQQRFI